MNVISEFKSTLQSAKSVVVISHIGPDGDTLGSMLALGEMMSQISSAEKVDLIISGRVPDVYKFLPGIANAKTIDNPTLYQSYDVAVTVDCASADRLGDSINLFRNAKKTINLDHHISNTEFADLNIVFSDCAATGQVLFRIAEELGININEHAAKTMYTAILTDTGGFRFENTSAEVLNVCAKLIAIGVNPTAIYKECYETKPLAMIRLQAAALSSLVQVENGRIAYASVSRELMDTFKASDDHVDGISEALRQIQNVEVGIVFKETPKKATKVSFRSSGPDVCEIAKYFGGGGHKLAAGCTVDQSIADTINAVLPIVKKRLNKS